jgi:hypothetical protein
VWDVAASILLSLSERGSLPLLRLALEMLVLVVLAGRAELDEHLLLLCLKRR